MKNKIQQEKANESSRKYATKNRVLVNQRSAAYKEKNRDEINKKSREYKEDNREDLNKKSKEYYKLKFELNPTEERKRRKQILLKCKYGISLIEYNIILDKQEGCCAICNKHHTLFKQALSVDHNHITGQVRGLLCNKCNLGIGIFSDNILLLENAIKYIKIYE